ncbi:MAG TPA: NUDIX domain-containing protein [Ktedonobacteraceae bacterium]|nr:NUDIX domain-containing protein [Ktedonobacteraceae bacterium]
MAAQPRSSSAVMLLRDATSGAGLEVFMVRRVIQSDFMPDVYVFPGGSVQPDDLAVEQEAGVCRALAQDAADPEGRTALGKGVRAAAIRELFEEGGVLLAYHGTDVLAVNEGNRERFENYRRAFNERKGSLVEMANAEQLTLASDRLNYFTHWITPEGLPKRFDTHFFVTTAPAEQQAIYDNLETSEGIWITPSEALERAERNTFPIVFATIHQLHGLAAFTSVAEALQGTASTPVKTHAPVLVEREGQFHVHLPEDASDLWAVPEHMTRVRH